MLVALELERGDLAAARAVFERYPEDSFALHAWARILERFLSGERCAAARAARLAERDNPHVRSALAGRTRPRKRDDGYFQPRTESEAAYVVDALGAAWAAHPQAVQWLREEAPTSTAEERRAAFASYAAPLCDLLTWGEPERRGEIDEQALAAFGREHVGDLVRMATDPALSEQDPDAAEVWAPIHAIRVLAHLRAPEAAEPLLGLLLEGFDDDWLIEELVSALSRIGSPSLPVLVRVLADDRAPDLARNVAAEVLGKIPGREPDARAEVVAALAAALRRFEDNRAELNAMLVLALVDAGAGEHAGLMREAFEAGRVDTTLCGSWEEIEEALELL